MLKIAKCFYAAMNGAQSASRGMSACWLMTFRKNAAMTERWTNETRNKVKEKREKGNPSRVDVMSWMLK